MNKMHSKAKVAKHQTTAVTNANLALLALFALCLLPQNTTASTEQIKSRAAVVMEASTGRILYAKNPDLQLMPASTTKLMTALVALEMTTPETVVTVGNNAAKAPPIKVGLKKGDKVTVETLLNAALVRSANDAAIALAEAAAGTVEQFVDLMNSKAEAIGLANTQFINPNGLPGKGQHTTAYDLAAIMKEAIAQPLLKKILATRVAEVTTEEGKTVFVQNTNKLLWMDNDFMGGKTGYTNQARHCFVGAGERQTGTLIVALLGTPSRDLLWKETQTLLDFGVRVLNNTEQPTVLTVKTDYDTKVSKKKTHRKKNRARKHRGKNSG